MADHFEVHEMYEDLLYALGAEKFLEQLYLALDTDTADEMFRHIMAMNDLDL